ncbi:EamA family transporter RarD [Pseudodesulfovibrio sp.]|uniref:EamA family transporter RarD n=1 Tax=unclassified Pseudodesulfovibrio TaxID=2661612 RepID=UPI003AFFEBAF
MTPRLTTDTAKGYTAALASFVAWGLLPIYWKGLLDVGPIEILCHRILWSLVFIAIILTARHRWNEVLAPLSSPRNLLILAGSSLCIGFNWLLYIWSVNTGHVVATSLGYYINPLVNVLLGFIFFRERLNRFQYAAVGLAATGVLVSVLSHGELPWISLGLAFSFGFYGLLRKIAAVASLPGLFLETMVLGPASLAYLIYLHHVGELGFLSISTRADLLLIGAGLVTSLPLIGFAFGARRLHLSTLGILQYASPSIAFLLGVFLYKEPFGVSNLITFSLIWTGLVLYTFDSVRALRRNRSAH